MRPAFDWFEVRVPSVGEEHHLNQSGEIPRTATSLGNSPRTALDQLSKNALEEEGPKNGIRSFS